MMACHYMIWNREAGHTGNLKGSLQYCGADSDASGLCPEHAAFVADAKCPEVSKLDQKYWYRVPAKRKAKLGPSSVKHTVEPPSPRRLEYVAWKAEHAKQDKGVIQGALDEDKRAIAASKPSPFTADGQAKIARACAAEAKREERQKPLSKSAARKVWAEREAITRASPEYLRGVEAAKAETARREAEWKAAQAKMPDTSRPAAEAIAEPTAETVCGFRFEYRAEGGSGFYWNGKRVASTREGLERMGPAVLARICK